MNECANREPNGSCPHLKGGPLAKIQQMYNVPTDRCMFCINDIAEICDKYRKA